MSDADVPVPNVPASTVSAAPERGVPILARPLDPAPAAAAPIAATERVEAIDVIRGFALLGILLVNMAFFSGPFLAEALAPPLWPGTADRAARWAVRFFAETKFYSLFSFLFGVGMAVQMLRAEQRGAKFGGLYARRLLILLLFGVAHGLFVWAGDILLAYALIGFVLLLFRRRRDRTLLVWAVILLLTPGLLIGGLVGVVKLAKTDPATAQRIERNYAEEEQKGAAFALRALHDYAHGPYREIFDIRLQEWLLSYLLLLPFMAPSILAMFLLGLWAGRRGIWQDLPAHLPWIRCVALWGLAAGIVSNLGYTVGTELYGHTERLSGGLLFLMFCDAIAAPSLCFFYAAALILLWHRPGGAARLKPLAAVGRMALSNYLFQSLVCTTLFYSYGLGLYGKIGPAWGVALTLAIYFAQIVLSNWWLRRFRFGPAEWLWRSLTYLRRQPFRL